MECHLLVPSEHQAQAEKWITDHATENLQRGDVSLDRASRLSQVNPARLAAWEEIVSKSRVFRCLSLVHSELRNFQIVRVRLAAQCCLNKCSKFALLDASDLLLISPLILGTARASNLMYCRENTLVGYAY